MSPLPGPRTPLVDARLLRAVNRRPATERGVRPGDGVPVRAMAVRAPAPGSRGRPARRTVDGGECFPLPAATPAEGPR